MLYILCIKNMLDKQDIQLISNLLDQKFDTKIDALD